MTRLILINGAPGSGKSTLARLLAPDVAFTLVVDIDSIRGALGGWEERPSLAGRLARARALELMSAHLSEGYDVIVPQFLAKPDFVEELQDTADDDNADFIELVLTSSAEEAEQRFAQRATSEEWNHRDARLLQAAVGAPSISEGYRAMLEMTAHRPGSRYIPTVAGQIAEALALVRAALAAPDAAGAATGDRPASNLEESEP